jgi:hypothetical protein
MSADDMLLDVRGLSAEQVEDVRTVVRATAAGLLDDFDDIPLDRIAQVARRRLEAAS